jgi:OOP family OmpA-OmpF porin
MNSTMRHIRVFSIILVIFLAAFPPAMAQDEDAEEEAEEETAEEVVKDTPYFSGMPNYRIDDSKDQEFGDYKFINGKTCTTVEGRKFFRAYTLKAGAKMASDLQITRNYANAVKSMGGTVIVEGPIPIGDCSENADDRVLIGQVKKPEYELWIEVAPFNGGNDYYQVIVVKELMKQTVTSSDMIEALNRDGYFTLHINFDPGKSILKAEYNPVVEQIAEMMRQNPELAIIVEGHTDGRGDRQTNLPLSEARAGAVMKAIVSLGIDPKRLSAVGYGPDRPIAPIDTEEGLAKNRRVEIRKK